MMTEKNLDMSERLMSLLRELTHMMRFRHKGKEGQARILVLLNESDGMTQRELTRRLCVQPGSASEILAKLENAGLIIRQPNADDRRTTDVQLTNQGRTLAAEAVEQRQKQREEMFSCLSAEEKATMLALMEKLAADWRARLPEDGHPHGHGSYHHECPGHHHGGHGPHHRHGSHDPHDHRGQ